MVYRALGALSSSHGLTVAFAEFHENAGAWAFEIKESKRFPTGGITALVLQFIEERNLQYQVALITVHGDAPGIMISGASIAAQTGLPVITDLEDLDKELGGNGEFYSSCLQRLKIDGDNTELNKTICVAFMGILRWREEYNFLSSVTGASRSSIGGAIWIGQEA